MQLPLAGLIPAAGRATRIAPLPCSKELFPVGYHTLVIDGQPRVRPRVVSHFLVDAMIRAGVARALFVLNDEKWDIVRYYGNGRRYGISLAYTVQDDPRGMPVSLDAGRPWIAGHTVVFGMPDTIFGPPDTFVHLLRYHEQRAADVTLGLFPTTTPSLFGMVDLDPDGLVRRCVDKPATTTLTLMWGCACWSPRFTEFLHAAVTMAPSTGREIVLGDVFSAAVEQGLRVVGLPVPGGQYADIGTAEELQRMVALFAEGGNPALAPFIVPGE